jgi:tetratricopeptide (TPR) repeat protein
MILIPVTVLVSLLAAGGVIGITFSMRNEQRAGQLHDLQISGEASQQARAEDIHTVLLDSSQKTISLVNQTLELARESSERAEKTLSQRAERLLHEITSEATVLFVQAHYHPRFAAGSLLKVIVEEPPLRSEVLDLAQRLTSIEGYLEFQEIPLTPSAFLIKGMSYHLKQDEKRAIRDFERAAEDKDANPKIRQFAYFWMGYACNNVGNYLQAAEVFSHARRFEGEFGLPLELGRFEEESRFFELTRRDLAGKEPATREEVQQLFNRLLDLANDAERAQAVSIARKIATTTGNIYTWLGRTRSEPAERNEILRKAIEMYEKGDGIWADFGKLEAAFDIDEVGPDRAGYAKVEELANKLTQERAEPRSLTLLYLTTAICMVRQEKSTVEVEGVMRALRKSFADVEGVTVYSQHHKTNLRKEDFNSIDLNELELQIAKLAEAGASANTADRTGSSLKQ